MKKILIVLAMAMAVGCTKEKVIEVPTKVDGGSPKKMDEEIDAKKIAETESTSEAKAEAVARAGERIVFSSGFMYADELFDIALEYNPKNMRARVYKAMLAPQMSMKGIAARIEPIIKTLPYDFQQKWYSTIENYPDKMFRDFVRDGKPDINTESELQAVIRDTLAGVSKFRKLTEELKDQNLHVYYRKVLKDQAPNSSCTFWRHDFGWYTVAGCEIADSHEFDMEYADFKAVGFIAAAYQFYFALPNAYDLTGTLNMATLFNGQKMTDERFFNAVKGQPKMGQLVAADVLKDFQSLGLEAIEAIKWAIANRQLLCPTGSQNFLNRPGTMFSEGFCPAGELIKALPSFELGLKDKVPVSVKILKGNPGEYTTMINAPAFLDGKLTDLKVLAPNRFDHCGQATELPDTSMGGIFPYNDMVTFIRFTSDPKFLNKPCN